MPSLRLGLRTKLFMLPEAWLLRPQNDDLNDATWPLWNAFNVYLFAFGPRVGQFDADHGKPHVFGKMLSGRVE